MNSPNAVIVLDDGTFYVGNFVGNPGEVRGELCFNTAMTGYQEAITDPSYYSQIVIFTFPYVGNAGANSQDNESTRVHLAGLVIANEITPPSNYRAEEHFNHWLKRKNVTGICNLNTRKLVRKIRDSKKPIQAIIGAYNNTECKEILTELTAKINPSNSLAGKDLSIHVQKEQQLLHSKKKKIIVLDFGLKKSIYQALQTAEFDPIVLPSTSSFEEIIQFKPAGIVLSNGPGDPRATYLGKEDFIQKVINSKIPLLGICLGFQLIGLALGGTIAQLTCGHHGSNHPVYDDVRKKTFITSQNHEFHLLLDSLPSSIQSTHTSLFDGSLEGFILKNQPLIAVQFHPEGNPGPNDCHPIFIDFLKMAADYAQKN